jgi:hypothetical protein
LTGIKTNNYQLELDYADPKESAFKKSNEENKLPF